MNDIKRTGRTMRAILVALYAHRGAGVTTARLAKDIEASESATRHSLARLVEYGMVEDHSQAQRRCWHATEAGWTALNALWAKEGGAAGA